MRITIKPGSKNEVLTGHGTKVYMEDGTEIPNIYDLTVSYPIGGAVSAKMEIYINPGEIEAHPLLGLNTVKKSAEAHGYMLVPASRLKMLILRWLP